MTESRISEVGDRSTEFIEFEQQRENRLRKMNRISGTYGTIKEDLTFILVETQKEKKK